MNFTRHTISLSALIISLFIFSVSCFNNPSDSDERAMGQVVSHPYAENSRITANDILSGENFTKLIVEVDYMEGYEPEAEALDSLKSFIERRVNKKSVTILEPTQIPASGQVSYSTNEIRNLEGVYRSTFTQDSTISAYVIIVDGKFERGKILGFTYFYNSNVLFGGTLDEVSGEIGQPSRILAESVSFQHEFSHLLGLVNTSDTNMQVNHQDLGNGNHCDNESCLMYHAFEKAEIFGQFLEEEIPGLDANCITDLRANGGR